MPVLRRVLLPVLLLWIVAGGVILWTRAVRPTPEKLAAYMESHPIGAAGEGERESILLRVAGDLNRLDFEQRRELRADGELRKFFESLRPDERSRFLDLTLPEGFRQMMLALNKMDPARRKKLVDRALEDLRSASPELAERVNEEEVRKILAEGVGSFYEQASAEVKMEFAPVLEELQRNVQRLR